MAAKKDEVSVDESIAQTEAENAPEASEPKKGELTGSVLKDRVEYPAGTKVADLSLSADEKARLERLGLIA